MYINVIKAIILSKIIERCVLIQLDAVWKIKVVESCKPHRFS